MEHQQFGNTETVDMYYVTVHNDCIVLIESIAR